MLVLPPVPGDAPLPEEVPPAALEPLPVVMPSSFRHFSRSVPIMPRHLLEVPLLEELVLDEPLLGEVPGEGLALLPDAP
jgi:hypothetical protein